MLEIYEKMMGKIAEDSGMKVDLSNPNDIIRLLSVCIQGVDSRKALIVTQEKLMETDDKLAKSGGKVANLTARMSANRRNIINYAFDKKLSKRELKRRVSLKPRLSKLMKGCDL